MLSANELRLLSQLLDHAMELTGVERETWLDGLDGPAAALAPNLRRMLDRSAAKETADLLERGPSFDANGYLHTDAGFAVGNTVGPYRLVRELGRGGMGEVWLAERSDGQLKRQVALKLPTLGMRRSMLVERFARECDILSQLVHPNIARLYDAGLADDGQPYMALEYVEGTSLTAYCNERRLGTQQRLALALQVLDAVQYAHTRLVIHRDLKPDNILVTAENQVRLLDFGVARLLATDPGAEASPLTRLGGPAFTPEYASPEQVRGDTLATTSDVYSLGVVLYELLCGQRPYKLQMGSASRIEQAILETDPALPSAQATPAAAMLRGSSFTALRRELQGDIDTIVMKALKKAPEARYSTVRELAEDLRRHTQGEPVLARPDSAWYRGRKFARRHWLPLSAATAVLVALVAGLGAALWGVAQAREQAARASVQEQLAQSETSRARAVQGFLEDIFQSSSNNEADPEMARKRTARELLDTGAKKIDDELKDAPEAQLEVYSTLAGLYSELGLDAQALELARNSVKVAGERFGADSVQRVDALIGVGEAAAAFDKRDEGRQALEQASAILDRAADTTSTRRGRLEYALASFSSTEQPQQTLVHADRAVALLGSATDAQAREDLIGALHLSAVGHARAGEFPVAAAHVKRALDIAMKPGPRGRIAKSWLPHLYGSLGQAQSGMADYGGAEASYREALRLNRSFDEGDRYAPISLASASNVALLLNKTSRPREGLAILELPRKAAARQAGQSGVAGDVIYSVLVHSALAFNTGLPEESRKDVELAERMLRRGEAMPDLQVLAAERRAALAFDVGHWAEAQRELDRAFDLHHQLGRDGTRAVNDAIALRIQCAIAQGQPREATQALQQFVLEKPGAGALSVTTPRRDLLQAEIALAEKDLDTAAKVATAIEASVKGRPDVYYRRELFGAARVLGEVALERQDAKAASAAFARALALGAIFDARSPALIRVHLGLAQAHMLAGDREDAGRDLANARAILTAHPDHLSRWAASLSAVQRAAPGA